MTMVKTPTTESRMDAIVEGQEVGGSFEYRTKNGEWTEVEGNVFKLRMVVRTLMYDKLTWQVTFQNQRTSDLPRDLFLHLGHQEADVYVEASGRNHFMRICC